MDRPDIAEQMRSDWNRRALEDAGYYVAFGRRGQDEAEFTATARDVIRGLERELGHLGPLASLGGKRALEIGCGPGRLMLPLSRHFGEIHGVDVSDEMIRLARERLRDAPRAHAHVGGGSDLAGFEDESFDFVYSYAVFQHIPAREVVFDYLREACRVLRSDGLMYCQLNGLPKTAARYDTWSGVRVDRDEVIGFARENGLQLLALEGASTQYMWVTARKRAPGAEPGPAGPATRLRRITNTYSSEPVAPRGGRFAAISLWVESLPPECDIVDLKVSVGSREGSLSYIGPPAVDGLRQLNAGLPSPIETGIHPVRLWWRGAPLTQEAPLRVVPPGPAVPRLISLTDGIDLLSTTRITSGVVKVTFEELDRPSELIAAMDGEPLRILEIFCTDPQPPRFEINLEVPRSIPNGPRLLRMRIGQRQFPPVAVDICS